MSGLRLLVGLLASLVPVVGIAQTRIEHSPAEILDNEQAQRLQLGRVSSDWEEFENITGYCPPPETIDPNSLIVEWKKLERDPLGLQCKATGELKIRDGRQFRSVDWLQGVTAYMAIKPDTKLDWSNGIDEDLAIGIRGVIRPDGTFSIKVRLDEVFSQRDIGQPFQFGLALAKTTFVGEKARIAWDSKSAPIQSSVQMLDLPAAPRLSLELNLMRLAAGWPDEQPNGVALIRAVNALRLQGTSQSIATLKRYVNLLGDDPLLQDEEIIFWIDRLLYEPVTLGDRIPAPAVFRHIDLLNDRDEPLWPLKPIEVVDDIPFMVGTHSSFEGEVDRAELDFDRIRRCVIRDQPLAPTNHPLAAANKIILSAKFARISESDRKVATLSLRKQACAMVADLLPAIPDGIDSESDEYVTAWQERLAMANELQISWDSKIERFVARRK